MCRGVQVGLLHCGVEYRGGAGVSGAGHAAPGVGCPLPGGTHAGGAGAEGQDSAVKATGLGPSNPILDTRISV